MIKIGLTADWHFGVFTHSYTTAEGVPSRTVDAYEGVEKQLEIFRRENCDVIVVAGDLFPR
jgi:DNA repair exonuclease SbcCD nuclease subunit